MNPMKMRGWTGPLALMICSLLLAAGCVDYRPDDGKAEYQAPVISGGDAGDLVDLRGNLDFGQTAEDRFSQAKPLTGYVFDAHAGARVTLTLTVDNGEDPVLILYGPADGQGNWGTHLALDDDGKDGLNSLLSNIALPADGRYLVAAATYDGSSGGDFRLMLGCTGQCDEPRCADDQVLCDLYCPGGFMTDSDGCPLCRCAQAECQADADCALPWSDGLARCVEGRCIYDELVCDDATACPAGYVCVQGPCPGMPCTPDGECPPCPGVCEPAPECVEGDRCVTAAGVAGQCLGGRCVPDAMPCMGDADCPEGMLCQSFCDYPCGPDDPNCPPCEGACVPVDPAQCSADFDCPPGMVCAMECWGWCDENGACFEECRGQCIGEEPPLCVSDEECMREDGIIGQCLNGVCVFDDLRCDDGAACPPGMVCQMACWDCDPNNPDCIPGCEGYCVPDFPPQCFSDYDCISEDGTIGRCLDGRCVFDALRCQADYECPPGFACRIEVCLDWCTPDDPACCYGVCVPDQPDQCRSDDECIGPDGTMGRCMGGVCMFDSCACPDVWDPVCAEICYPVDCPDGDPDCVGACEQRTFSNACDATCAYARILYAGECGGQQTECRVDADCRPGEYCEYCMGDDPAGPCSDLGVCLPLPPMECQGDDECPMGFRCEPGYCPDGPCGPDGCPPCFGQCVPADQGCIQTGCSGEICAPYPVSSTCIWLPEYECLVFASCETLFTADGQMTCGWTQPPAYLECLANLHNANECDSDAQCGPGQFCQVECWDDGFCQGRCLDADCVCPEYYDPVCGADGVTYDNICFANCAGADLLFFGSCGEDRP